MSLKWRLLDLNEKCANVSLAVKENGCKTRGGLSRFQRIIIQHPLKRLPKSYLYAAIFSRFSWVVALFQIVANYSKTSVSTHVVDLNRLSSQMMSQNSNNDVTASQDTSATASNNKAPNAGEYL